MKQKLAIGRLVRFRWLSNPHHAVIDRPAVITRIRDEWKMIVDVKVFHSKEMAEAVAMYTEVPFQDNIDQVDSLGTWNWPTPVNPEQAISFPGDTSAAELVQP